MNGSQRVRSEALPPKRDRGEHRRARWLPRGRPARAVVFVVAAAIALELLYLVGGNLGLRWASRRVALKSGVSVDYASGYTLVPGRVHLTDLQLGGVADSGWRARSATADIVVGLGDLVTLTSHLERVRMTGVAVELGLPPSAVVSLVSSPRRTPQANHVATGLVPASLLAALAGEGSEGSKEAEVADPSASLLRVDDAVASVTELTYGGRKLDGDLEVHANGLVLRRVGTTLAHADLHVVDAALASGDEPVARHLHGQIDVRIDPDETRPIVGRASAHVKVDGELVSVAPLLSLAGLDSAGTHAGELHAAGALDHGVVAAGSELRAEASPFDLHDAAGDVVSLPGGLVVSVGAEPTPHRLHFKLRAPKVVLASSDPGKGGDSLEGVLVDVDGGEANLASPRAAVRGLTWAAKRAVVHEGASILSAALHGSLQIAAGPLDAAGIVAESGELEASDVRLDEPTSTSTSASTEHAAFGARLLLSSGKISKEGGLVFGGQVKASGPDAGVLLSLFGASPAIRLALGSLTDKPFTMNGTLARHPRRLALEDVHLESNGVSVDGAYYRRDDSRRAAFVVTYGRLPLGVSIVDGADHVVFAPPSDWLAAQTREAATLLAP